MEIINDHCFNQDDLLTDENDISDEDTVITPLGTIMTSIVDGDEFIYDDWHDYYKE